MWEQFTFALKCTGSSKKKVKKRYKRTNNVDTGMDNGLNYHAHKTLLASSHTTTVPGKELYA